MRLLLLSAAALLAAAVPAAGQGPAIVVEDVPEVLEPATAPASAVFIVRLTEPSSFSIAVTVVTADGTATGGADYQPRSLATAFPPGQTILTVPVTILPDAIPEQVETFFLRVVNAGAPVARGEGTAFIRDPMGVSCSFSIAPAAAHIAAAGGTGTVGVMAAPGCAWKATTDASFITIESGASGSGNGTVVFTVAPNPFTVPRSGVLTVADHPFTVDQDAAAAMPFARQFRLPHWEASRRELRRGRDASDTILHVMNAERMSSGETWLRIYIQDERTGAPLASRTGADACNPCEILVGAPGQHGPSKTTISVRELIRDAGGIRADEVAGAAVIEVAGPDAASVGITSSIVSSGDSRELVPLQPVASPPAVRTHLAPHVFETKGTSRTPFSFDFTFVAANAGGIGGVADRGSSEVTLLLFDESSGRPLRGRTGEICGAAGCRFTLAPGQKLRTSVEQLAHDRAGGLGRREVVTAYAVITVEGGGADATNLFAFITNHHSSAFDLSVIGFTPEEVRATCP